MGIFSLDGMERLALESPEYDKLAIEHILSNSQLSTPCLVSLNRRETRRARAATPNSSLPTNRMITVALPKGALLKDCIQLFQSVGLDFSAFLDKNNRQLQITDPTNRAKALLVRTHDVPVYVEYGQAQLGIAGYDVLREKTPQVAQLVDLKFGTCRLSVAVKADSPYQTTLSLPAHGRVASKFVHCAREYFDSIDLPIEIVPLYGSVELGPITGMSEAIVDLVSTGKTLKENGLVEIETLFYSSARLIAHPLSYRIDRDEISDLVAQIRNNVSLVTSQ